METIGKSAQLDGRTAGGHSAQVLLAWCLKTWAVRCAGRFETSLWQSRLCISPLNPNPNPKLKNANVHVTGGRLQHRRFCREVPDTGVPSGLGFRVLLWGFSFRFGRVLNLPVSALPIRETAEVSKCRIVARLFFQTLNPKP